MLTDKGKEGKDRVSGSCKAHCILARPGVTDMTLEEQACNSVHDCSQQPLSLSCKKLWTKRCYPAGQHCDVRKLTKAMLICGQSIRHGDCLAAHELSHASGAACMLPWHPEAIEDASMAKGYKAVANAQQPLVLPM